MSDVRILLLTGSTRAASTNTALLRAAAEVAPEDVRATLWAGLTELPHFDPDDDVDPLPAPVARMRAAIAQADAVLVCTPEYAGALPGSFKNLLDWTVGGTETSGKPFGWVNASGRPGGATGAHEELRTVLSYTDARLVDAACVAVPVHRADVVDGVAVDRDARAALVVVLAALVDAVR
ncbi:NADPH-dependent FMN reductase [Patulibacter sp.]|uniref:NADPH-dependent FMN reductase n=1 Tax=Patulibacter sp. TaxID=1912859 RepID=UPI002721909C|nr:NAD(P)H-dependent oxidoreductase [Patulibacter sp.]MDO9406839.1 NAD(P)H-dependent oxidoreductase [Patulibacter sp.]